MWIPPQQWPGGEYRSLAEEGAVERRTGTQWSWGGTAMAFQQGCGFQNVSLYFWQKMSGQMNPGSPQVQVWICSVSLCQLCWRRDDCHTTVPSHSSYLATSPLHQHCSWLACYLPSIFFSSSLIPWTDQYLEFTKCQISCWELNTDEKMLESWWKLLESSIIYPLEKYTAASIRASTMSPGSPVVLWDPAEFDDCSRSAVPFWLLALCHIPFLMGTFCSRPASFRKDMVNFPCWHKHFWSGSDPLSFPINTLGSTSFFGVTNTLRSNQFRELGKIRSLFWCIFHLEKCYKNMKSLLELVGKFILHVFFCHKGKYIQTEIVCGKWDDLNRFSSSWKSFKSSKTIFLFFFND